VEMLAGGELFHRIRAELAPDRPRPARHLRRMGADTHVAPLSSAFRRRSYLEVYQGPIQSLDLDRAALGVRLNHRSSRVADPEGLMRLAPQTTVDIELTLLFLRRRLLDTGQARQHARRKELRRARSPLPGRSVHGSMEVWW